MKNVFDEFDDNKTPVNAVIDPTTQTSESPLSAKDVAYGAMQNLIPSGVGYAKNLATPFLHPSDTVSGIRDIAFGGLGKVIPGADVGNQQQVFDAFKQAIINRYGGIENIKRTIATDPVGILGDASGLVTGGGSLLAKAPGMLGKAGQMTANVGRAIEPLNAVTKPLGMMGSPILDKIPMRLYESAIKPPAESKKLNRANKLQVLQEGLDNGIVPTQAGIDKLEGLIKDINRDIKNTISTGATDGKTVNVLDIANRLDDTEKFFKEMPDNKSYLDAIEKVREGLLDKGDSMGNIPLSQAQKMKTTIYRVLKDSYGELSTATKEANKAVARGAKEEIANIFPEINYLNNKESLLLKLEPMIEKAAGRINKRDLMGIGTPIAGGAIGAVTSHGVGQAAMLAKAVLDNPKAKAYLAIALNNSKKGKPNTKWVDGRLTSYFASKATDAEQNAQSLIPTAETLIPKPEATPVMEQNPFDEFDNEGGN